MNAFDSTSDTLCLGLVVFPESGREAAALEALRTFSGLQLGEPQGHKIPAVAEVRRGEDKQLIRELESMQSILQVAVVYAQALPGEQTP